MTSSQENSFPWCCFLTGILGFSWFLVLGIWTWGLTHARQVFYPLNYTYSPFNWHFKMQPFTYNPYLISETHKYKNSKEFYGTIQLQIKRLNLNANPSTNFHETIHFNCFTYVTTDCSQVALNNLTFMCLSYCVCKTEIMIAFTYTSCEDKVKTTQVNLCDID